MTAVAVALGIVTACLPDLAPLPVEPVSEAAPLRTCGDGVIAAFDDGGDAGESCDPGDAATPGCDRCQIVCEGRLRAETGHCYFRAGTAAEYRTAYQQCAGQRAHLVTFASDEEAAFVDALASSLPAGDGDGGDGRYWVGLSNSAEVGAWAAANAEEPGWPAPPLTGPCEGCFARGTDDAGAFSAESGLDGGAELSCLVAAGATWLRAPCGGGRSFATICEREPVGQRLESCAGGYCFDLPVTAGKKTYLLDVSSATASEAESFCVSQYGGRLVVFDSAEEREEVARAIGARFRDATFTSFEFWIGLGRDAGGWAWEDGTPLGEGGRRAPWGDRQPGAGERAYTRLAQAAYDGQLAYTDDGGAGAARPFVCERSVR